MNTCAAERARNRRRISFAVLAWSSLSLISAINAVIAHERIVASLLTAIFVTGVIAAILARGSTLRRHLASAVLLLFASAPFAVKLATRLAFASSAHPLEIADSPVGYVAGTVVDSLFFAPPVVFALGIWSRWALEK